VQRRNAGYPILYLACDGGVGELWLGSDGIGFDELAGILEGKCLGRTVLFGACLTLKLPDEALLEFVSRIGAKAVVGYEKPVDWLDSAAFETLLLSGWPVGTAPTASSTACAVTMAGWLNDLGWSR
jgi:hypothetical protein